MPRRRLACWTVTPSNRLLRPDVQLLEGGSAISESRIKSLSESMMDGDLNSREKRLPPRPMVLACTDLPPAATTMPFRSSTTAISNTDPGVLNEPTSLPDWAAKTLTVGFKSLMLPQEPAAMALPVWEKEMVEKESWRVELRMSGYEYSQSEVAEDECY